MTAPAAALIQRPTLARAVSEPTRQARPAALDTRDSAGFAAHLERRTRPRAPEQSRGAPAPANDTRKAVAPLARTATPKAVPSDTAATEAATGKALPGKRQNFAASASQAAAPSQSTPTAEGSAASSHDTAKPDAELENSAAEGSQVTLIQALLTAPSMPAAAPRGTASQPTDTAAQLGITQQNSAGRSASAAGSAAPGQTPSGAAAAQAGSSASPAATVQAAIAAPAVAFVLERDGLPAGPSDPAGSELTATTAQPGAVQNAARAEPSTLATLTGTTAATNTAARKERTAAESELPAAKAGTAQLSQDITASALPQTQPVANATDSEPAAPVSAPPAEGIGFDALVDSIARARDGAADGAPVAVAMRHAEFGRISLRFQAEADGLSVAMTSADPAFAPAVAAAQAAEAAAATSTEATQRTAQSGTGSQSGGNAAGSSNMQGGTQSGSSQRQEATGQSRIASNPTRRDEATADDSRGGIFA